MKCPKCGNSDTRVVDSRPADNGLAIRRRRQCPHCSFRFTTHERVEPPRLTVIKRDGRKEPFVVEKLRAGMAKALTHTAADSPDTLERAVLEVESAILSRGRPAIESAEIAALVLAKLKELDKVAYVRFASVHKQFDEPEKFKEEVDRLFQGAIEER